MFLHQALVGLQQLCKHRGRVGVGCGCRVEKGTARASVTSALGRELTAHLSPVERGMVIGFEFRVCVLALVSVFALFRVGKLLASTVVDVFAGNGAVRVGFWVSDVQY